MQELNTYYPVRIVSRSVAKKRFRRVSWFVLGASFGVIFALHATGSFNYSALFAAQLASTNGASLEDASDIHTTQGIDIVALALPSAPAKPASKPHVNLTYPLSLAMRVEDGDTLVNLLTDAGAPYEEAQAAVASLGKIYDPKRLDIGLNIDVVLDKPADSAVPIIASVRVPASANSVIEITHKVSGSHDFAIKKIIEPVERKLAHAGGRIDSSLYETGMNSGIPASLLNDIITAYSYDIDFQRDLQPGDTLDVLYERLETKNGAAAGHGNILYAELNVSGEAMRIYRYVDKSGMVDYYNERGESLRKAMLRTPINGAKITSGYGMRNHPILGYSKMHRGVDFGAPTGTPIYAAGDGTIDFAGHKGGYGNYLRIKHNDKYSSAYGHISRFASNVSPGHRVHQGQIVAYVGATGMATGPHLHYEILINNEQVNPSSVKFRAGNVLAGKEMNAFRKNMEQIEAQRDNTPRKTDIAKAHGKELVVAEE